MQKVLHNGCRFLQVCCGYATVQWNWWPPVSIQIRREGEQVVIDGWRSALALSQHKPDPGENTSITSNAFMNASQIEFKGTLPSEMIILSSFSHRHVIQNLFDFFYLLTEIFFDRNWLYFWYIPWLFHILKAYSELWLSGNSKHHQPVRSLATLTQKYTARFLYYGEDIK